MKKSKIKFLDISNFGEAQIPSNQLIKIQGGNNMREETGQDPPGSSEQD